MKIKLAFYKGKGDWTDKLIRLWTHSKYSHVELIINGLWYSTSPRDLRVRAKQIEPKQGHWDFVEIDVSIKQKKEMVKFFKSQFGKKYDWLGIFLSQVIPLNIQEPSRWFCSEICSCALKKSNVLQTQNQCSWFSPERLLKESLKVGNFIEG